MRKTQPLDAIFLAFFILVYIDFFLFMPYARIGVSKYLKALLLLYIAGYVLLHRIRCFSSLIFHKEIVSLMVLPFLSSISCYVYRNQPIMISIIAARDSLFWLFYFYLHKKGLSIELIMNVIKKIAIISSSIYIFQQLLYPDLYLFNSLQHYDEVEIRNGLYRFRLFALNPCIMISFYYTLYLYAENRNPKDLVLLVLFAVALFLTLTRNIYFCIFVPAFFYVFLKQRELSVRTIFYFIIGASFVLIVINNADIILGRDFVSKTQDELDESNVRVMSVAFYGLEYWKDYGNMILGNGIASWGNSAYGNEIQLIEEENKLFRSDIGIIGTFSTYGVVYIFAIILAYRRVFKVFKKTPVYLRMFIISTILNLPLGVWLEGGFYMSIVFYLMDKEIQKFDLVKCEK